MPGPPPSPERGLSEPPSAHRSRGCPLLRTPDCPPHSSPSNRPSLPSAVLSTTRDGPSILASGGFILTSCAQTGAGKSKRRGVARPGATALSSRSSHPSAGPGTTRGRRRGVPMVPALSLNSDGFPSPRLGLVCLAWPPSPGLLLRASGSPEGGTLRTGAGATGRGCPSSGSAPVST